jgi:hypothetical protein
MIPYKEKTVIEVRLDGKLVGHIRNNPKNGWYSYKPKGGGAGQEMGTIAEVKRSIEGR